MSATLGALEPAAHLRWRRAGALKAWCMRSTAAGIH